MSFNVARYYESCFFVGENGYVKQFSALRAKKNCRPLRGLYIWPLHSWRPSDALASSRFRPRTRLRPSNRSLAKGFPRVHRFSATTSHKSLIAFQKCDGHTYICTCNTCCHLSRASEGPEEWSGHIQRPPSGR